MVLFLFGPSCAGKSTIARMLSEKLEAELWVGKDYLRLARNEQSAWDLFKVKIEQALKSDLHKHKTLIFVANDVTQENLEFFDRAEIIKIKFIADLEILKSRFSARLKKDLPDPIIHMLNGQLLKFRFKQCNLEFDTTDSETTEIIDKIIKYIDKHQATVMT